MAWIKRNLFFLIGGVVALALLGGAGFYLFTQNQRNNELSQKLDETYEVLKQLNQQPILPGNSKVDNIKNAKEQHQQIASFIRRSGKFFTPIPPIPEGEAIADETFAAQLRNTIEQLQRTASAASVTLPPRYDFSFSAIKSKISFASGSLHPLAAQLGEVKAICDILFTAKINALDSIRRVRVSPDDKEVADYTDVPAVTNDLAVLTPFEITFRCFSGELADVLTGFAQSPYGFIVKSVAIEPSVAGGAVASPSPDAVALPMSAPPIMLGGRPMLNPEGLPNGVGAMPGAVPSAVPTPTSGGARGGLVTVLNERPLRVNLVVALVKISEPAHQRKPAN